MSCGLQTAIAALVSTALMAAAPTQKHPPNWKSIVISVAADETVTITADGKPITCDMLNAYLAARVKTRLLKGFDCKGLPTTTAQATPTFRTLHFLDNGNVRFDAGPELTLQQLEAEIKGMVDRRVCPNVHLAAGKRVSYDRVAAALALFQKYGCNDLGFRGIENLR